MPSGRLARTSAARVNGYIAASGFAWPYLADQLVLPFVLAGGGTFTTVKPSLHTLTAIDIARRFAGLRIALERQAGGEHLVGFG